MSIREAFQRLPAGENRLLELNEPLGSEVWNQKWNRPRGHQWPQDGQDTLWAWWSQQDRLEEGRMPGQHLRVAPSKKAQEIKLTFCFYSWNYTFKCHPFFFCLWFLVKFCNMPVWEWVLEQGWSCCLGWLHPTYIRVHGSESWVHSQSHFPANAHLRRQQQWLQ